jgi:hypothetical protein
LSSTLELPRVSKTIRENGVLGTLMSVPVTAPSAIFELSIEPAWTFGPVTAPVLIFAPVTALFLIFALVTALGFSCLAPTVFLPR